MSEEQKNTLKDFKQSSIELYGGVNEFSTWADEMKQNENKK